jgi:hypothetical protein
MNVQHLNLKIAQIVQFEKIDLKKDIIKPLYYINIMDITIKLDKRSNELYRQSIQLEIDYLENEAGYSLSNFINSDQINLPEYLNNLRKILNIDHQTIPESVQLKRTKMMDEINKHTYRQQWNKLKPFHKIVKLKEYILETYTDCPLAIEIIEKLSKEITDGKINTKKFVVYDPNAEKILSMPFLTVDIAKNTYQMKLT